MLFAERWRLLYGEERAEKILRAIEEKATRAFRVNSRKEGDVSRFENNFKKHPFVENAYYGDETLGKSVYFASGLIYIQDASAMAPAYLTPVKDDDLVLDLCAAPGGKASQIAERIPRGILYANDVSYARAKVLSANIERMGMKNVFVVNNEAEDFLINFRGYFDKVLLDAPCSGEGMFRKNAEAKQDWSEKKVLSCAETQKKLILIAFDLLKKGGILTYSTCTFEKEENEDVVRYLLAHRDARLIKAPILDNVDRGIDMPEALRFLPDKFNGEGQFVALLQKNDETTASFRMKKLAPIGENVLKLLTDFVQENLTLSFDKTRLYRKDDLLYLTPAPFTPPLKILRAGLLLGEIKEKRFVPAHALATSLKASDFQRVIELNENETNAYLRGEVLRKKYPNGYVLLTYRKTPLGLGKAANGVVKNLYPKGLRRR